MDGDLGFRGLTGLAFMFWETFCFCFFRRFVLDLVISI